MDLGNISVDLQWSVYHINPPTFSPTFSPVTNLMIAERFDYEHIDTQAVASTRWHVSE